MLVTGPDFVAVAPARPVGPSAGLDPVGPPRHALGRGRGVVRHARRRGFDRGGAPGRWPGRVGVATHVVPGRVALVHQRPGARPPGHGIGHGRAVPLGRRRRDGDPDPPQWRRHRHAAVGLPHVAVRRPRRTGGRPARGVGRRVPSGPRHPGPRRRLGGLCRRRHPVHGDLLPRAGRRRGRRGRGQLHPRARDRGRRRGRPAGHSPAPRPRSPPRPDQPPREHLVPERRRADGARPLLPPDEPGPRGAGRGEATAAGRHPRGADGGGPQSVPAGGAVLDQPGVRRGRRELRRQHRLRARVPGAAAGAVGRGRRRGLRRRGPVPGRAGRRRPRAHGDPGRQRRRVHDAGGAGVPRHVRRRGQQVRGGRPGGPGPGDAQVRVPLHGLAGGAVARGGGRLPRAVAAVPRRPDPGARSWCSRGWRTRWCRPTSRR